MKPYNNISQIEICNGLSEKEFYNKYVKNSVPVVITDKAEWTKLEEFKPEYFKSNYNHITRTVDGKRYNLSEIIDACVASTEDNKAPYPNIYDIPEYFPEYLDIIPEMNYGKSNRLFSRLLLNIFSKRNNQQQLFFGGKGCAFPKLHVDYNWPHTQLTQIIGDKEFILYPPNQTDYLYPEEVLSNYSQVDITNPDYKKFPLFKNAEPLKVTVKAGETIFIPSGWWHTTYIHNFNLTYAVDHVNAFNWNMFMDKTYEAANRQYPKYTSFTWVIKVYKVVMGRVFNIKEFFFN